MADGEKAGRKIKKTGKRDTKLQLKREGDHQGKSNKKKSTRDKALVRKRKNANGQKQEIG